MNLKQLQDMVNLDLEDNGSGVISYHLCGKTLAVEFNDDVGTVCYVVPDFEVLIQKILREYNGDQELSEVDAFWMIMNTEYKI